MLNTAIAGGEQCNYDIAPIPHWEERNPWWGPLQHTGAQSAKESTGGIWFYQFSVQGAQELKSAGKWLFPGMDLH